MTLLIALVLVMAPPDTLRLAELQQAALQQDPRTQQLTLEAEMAELRLDNLATRYYPEVAAQGEAAVQSDVTAVDIPLPNASVPSPSRDQYQLTLNVDQLLYDGGATAEQRQLQRIRRDVAQASARAERYPVREQVNQAYFAVLILQAQQEQLRVLDDDLQAQRQAIAARVEQGAALPGALDELDAERITVQQRRVTVHADRRTALARLGELTGRSLAEDAVLAMPDVSAIASDRLPRRRPEYAVFDQTKRQLQQQADMADVDLKPQVSAFAQGGVGRPGLNRFDDAFQAFGLVGVRLRWTLWDWNRADREQDALAAQQRIVDTQEEAFSRSLRLALARYRNDIERLTEALQLDARLIAHRQRIEAQAASQLDNGVITTADYLEKRNDVFRARLQQRLHRLQRLQARVQYLTTIGSERP